MHRRTPKTADVPIAKIRVDPTIFTDDNFVKSYISLENGKVQISLTRIDCSKIYTGFYIRQQNSQIDHISNLRDDHSTHIESIIRSGMRPPIDLFWSPHTPEGGGYICPDDENTLSAYRALEIISVPCRILRPIAEPTSEAAVWFRKKGQHVEFVKSIPPIFEGYSAYAGIDDGNPQESLKFLIEQCENTCSAITEFHREINQEIHYHQMLHAMSRRHGRALDSVARLLKLGRYEHAMALCRMLYEAFLNFYIDWISPQFFGPRFQLLSSLRHTQIRSDDDSWQALGKLQYLLENTASKARISPLGAELHENIYPSLSLIAHQSYGNLEMEAHGFEDGIFELDQGNLINLLNVITLATLSRINNDVGQGKFQ